MTDPPEMRILGLGTVTIDHVLTVSVYPEKDSKNEALGARHQVGGPVPIALSQLRRFGYSTSFLGRWGDDGWGQVVEKRFQREGIEFRNNSSAGLSTSVTQIWLEESTGQRTLVTSRVDEGHLVEMVDREFLGQFQVLHLDCWPQAAAIKAARMMKELGGRVSLDTGSPKPGVEELLRLADIVNCPKRFCESFLNESCLTKAAEKISQFGPGIVSVTDGENGATLSSKGQTLFKPALKLDHAVDTNGAGDAFSGALIHGVLQRWSPEKILHFAVTASGLKCLHPGNEQALPDEKLVYDMMEPS